MHATKNYKQLYLDVNFYLLFGVIREILSYYFDFVQFIAWEHDLNDIGQKKVVELELLSVLNMFLTPQIIFLHAPMEPAKNPV